jgi:hypothetical protein
LTKNPAVSISVVLRLTSEKTVTGSKNSSSAPSRTSQALGIKRQLFASSVIPSLARWSQEFMPMLVQ